VPGLIGGIETHHLSAAGAHFVSAAPIPEQLCAGGRRAPQRLAVLDVDVIEADFRSPSAQ
jgi:hypothetical protein